MTKTNYVKLAGTMYYPFLTVPDEYKGSKFWATKLEMDEENLEKFKASGIASHINPLDKDDPESPKVVRLKREFERDFNDGKGKRELGKPAILVKNGKEWTPIDEDIMIGNGTKAIIECEVFNTRMGTGHRMKTIWVTDLQEYVPDVPDPEAPDAPAEQDMDDAIPF